jgi:hypothetical protein
MISPAAAASELWITYGNAYALERRAMDGQVLSIVRVTTSPWMQDWVGVHTGSLGPDRPKPLVQGVFERSDGLLVVHGSSAAADWRPADGAVTRGGRTTLPGRSLGDVFATVGRGAAHIVDIVDRNRGVLASATLQNVALLPLNHRYARRLITDANGSWQVEIWEIVFRVAAADSD